MVWFPPETIQAVATSVLILFRVIGQVQISIAKRRKDYRIVTLRTLSPPIRCNRLQDGVVSGLTNLFDDVLDPLSVRRRRDEQRVGGVHHHDVFNPDE